MSVAFDDQGEIVPSLGVTSTSRPPGCRGRGAVRQQPIERHGLSRIERTLDLDEMPETGRDDARVRLQGPNARIELLEAERRQGGAAGNLEDRHAIVIVPPAMGGDAESRRAGGETLLLYPLEACRAAACGGLWKL